MKVISVFKTHVDIGFTDLPHKVLASYAHKMLKDVVETCEATAANEKSRRFVWTMPSFVLLHSLEHTTPDLRERTEALIDAGQIVWHAMPFTIRSEFFSAFELSHALDYAKELSRRYNKPMPRTAKMTDIPGHTQALVDALHDGGVEFIHLGCNPASTYPDVPRLFRWKSKSGKSIVVYYDKVYGSTLTPPEDWHYPVHLAMTITNDNVGVQSPDVIEKQISALNGKSDYTTGSLDDFWRELKTCNLDDLPVVEGELGDTWIHALGAFPESCEAIYPVKQDFEKQYNLLREKNDKEFDSLIQKYFDNLYLFGEHSGGVSSAYHIGTHRVYEKAGFLQDLKSKELIYANDGWNDERAWAFAARDAALELKKQVSFKYGEPIEEEETAEPEWSLKTEHGTLMITHKSGKAITLGYEYKVIGYETIERYIDIYLRDKPFWAYCDFGRYYRDPIKPETAVNSYPRIDDRTFVSKLKRESETETELTATAESVAESYEKYGNAKKLKVTAQVKGRKVSISVEAITKEPTMYAESGNITLTLNEPLRDILICKSGIEINPETDIVKGANTKLFAIDRYVKTNGIKIESRQTPLVSFGGNAIYEPNILPFKLPETPSVVFNLFNNMWGTGAPQWISGSFKAEYTIRLL